MKIQVFLCSVFLMNYKKMPNLADRLKYIRKYHNLSQVELAEQAGTTQQAIQQAEKGKARQPRYLHHLAQALDIPIDWMIFGDAVKNDSSSGTKIPKGFNEKSSDILETFFSMPKKDQKLIHELMKSRQKK